MDTAYIKEIIKFIEKCDISINSVEITPIKENTKIIQMFASAVNIRPSLSDVWIVGYTLFFTVFDGFLENKHNLAEGDSFKGRYNKLPDKSNLDIITKNCYRIIRIIRNGIQHNLSKVIFNDGNCEINYEYKSKQYKLSLSKDGVENLHTLIINIIQGKISGIYDKYHTNGHYEGIIYTQYSNMIKNIKISDDIEGDLKTLTCLNKLKLRAVTRYPVEDPKIVKENKDSVTFKYIKTNEYSTDYSYKGFLIPEEIGEIIKGRDSITFQKTKLEDKWRME